MPGITVDTEKLVYGLEEGIGNTRTFFAATARHERLRMTACGLVSTAIHAYALSEGIPSRLMLSSPRLSFDVDMQHVVPLLGEESDPLVVDASVSQFLGYAGVSTEYQRVTGQSVFPPEKVLDFALSDRKVVVGWLTNAALRFQAINQQPEGAYGIQLGVGPLSGANRQKLEKEYGKIWDPKYFRRWNPPHRVQRDAEVVSRSIPPGALQT